MYTNAATLAKTQLLKPELALPLIAFVVPLVLSGPQLLTGTIINSILYVSAVKLNTKKWYLVAAIPSVSTLAHNVLFGPMTIFLIFFLPVIWLGNLLLMITFKKLSEKTSLPVCIIAASGFKTLVLYFSSLIYFQFHLVPKIFITSMGLLQFMTAVSGGLAAYFLLKFIKSGNERLLKTH